MAIARSRNNVLLLLLGGGVGAVTGAITGCEVSALVGNHTVPCAPAGAVPGASIGVLLALFTTASSHLGNPSLRSGAAATLVFGVAAVGFGGWVAEMWGIDSGGDPILLYAVGPGVAAAGISTCAIAVAVVKGRAWGRRAGIISFGLCVPAALASLIAEADAGGTPVIPAAILGLSIGIVSLLLLGARPSRSGSLSSSTGR